mmetsp:Transcript_64240/g.162778  ORF Transcript_64240/g.162778 Transcript_64240/m.162778 type:complete len:279 (+) Transcript_64240:407-1243(+)
MSAGPSVSGLSSLGLGTGHCSRNCPHHPPASGAVSLAFRSCLPQLRFWRQHPTPWPNSICPRPSITCGPNWRQPRWPTTARRSPSSAFSPPLGMDPVCARWPATAPAPSTPPAGCHRATLAARLPWPRSLGSGAQPSHAWVPTCVHGLTWTTAHWHWSMMPHMTYWPEPWLLPLPLMRRWDFRTTPAKNKPGSPSPRPRVTNPTHPGVASLPCLGPPVCSPGVASLPRPAADLPHPHHPEVASLPPPIPRSARPSPCPHTLLNIWVSAFTLVIRTCPS